MSEQQDIDAFLDGAPFAVVGASTDRAKYGNKVLRCYMQNGREVHPVHRSASEIEGLPAFASLADLPDGAHAVSIITPPAVTEGVVEQAIAAGVKYLWMQPGAESDAAIERARAAGLTVIANGPCLLVVLGYRE